MFDDLFKKKKLIQSFDFRGYKKDHVYLLIALCRTATIVMYKIYEKSISANISATAFTTALAQLKEQRKH